MLKKVTRLFLIPVKRCDETCAGFIVADSLILM